MQTEQFEDVLQFWFPARFDRDQATLVQQWQWWFCGGGDADISKQFSLLLAKATQGELDAWSNAPRSRLALIIILDQFSRAIHQGTTRAFAQDPKACRLALEGIEIGHYSTFKTPWEKTFFLLPLGHSEDIRNLDLAVKLAEELVREAPQEYRDLLEFSAEQARRHQAIIACFGRHPHRNVVLGRKSTPEELEYLATGQLVHTRSLPSHLAKFLSKQL